ncbi:MAG: FAD-dependent oxidoreductase, partial [Vicinamibacteria bacterium]
MSGDDLAPGHSEAGRDETFPTLTAAQIGRIEPFARERRFAGDEDLWTQGDRNRPLYVVLGGAIVVLTDQEHVVTVHGAGAFSGDVDLLSGRPVVVTGRARGATRVLELPPDRLRALVQTDTELSEIFLRAFILRRMALMAEGKGSVALLGSRHCALTLTLQEFLTRNSVPFAYLDLETDPGVQATLDGFALTLDDVPVLICRGTHVLKKPTVAEAAACLELDEVHDDHVHDVAVVGAGPAGLAAAVYAASEGLDVLVLESSAPGGQAGSSSRIENYLGFPTGISGQLLAGRAFVQAEKFGAEFAVARTALRLSCESRLRR